MNAGFCTECGRPDDAEERAYEAGRKAGIAVEKARAPKARRRTIREVMLKIQEHPYGEADETNDWIGEHFGVSID